MDPASTYQSFFINQLSFIICIIFHLYACLYPSAGEVQRVWQGYNYQAGSYTPVVTFDLVVIPQWLEVIPQWLEVIPQWLVVIPQQGKFKAPQSIIKKCVNTQVNICEEQLGTMDYFVVCYQKLRYKQVISHTCGISLLFTLCLALP